MTDEGRLDGRVKPKRGQEAIGEDSRQRGDIERYEDEGCEARGKAEDRQSPCCSYLCLY